MLCVMRKRVCNVRGQSVVEFGLILPILAMLLFAIIDFGNVFYQYNTANMAAREGARRAVVQGTTAQIRAAVRNFDPALAVAISFSDPKADPDNAVIPASGTTVTVTATKTLSFLTPLDYMLPKTVAGKCTMLF